MKNSTKCPLQDELCKSKTSKQESETLKTGQIEGEKEKEKEK